MKFATQHPKYAGLVVMPDGSTETKAAAIDQGFTVNPPRAVSRSGSTSIGGTSKVEHDLQMGASSPQAVYRSAIMALPEAASRRAAADRLASEHNASTLSPASAASILRGLPLELHTTAKGADTPMTSKLSDVDASRFRRLCEIRVCALRLNAARGNQKAAVEAKRLDHAMRAFDMGGITFSQAVEGSGLDVNHTLSKILNEKIKD